MKGSRNTQMTQFSLSCESDMQTKVQVMNLHVSECYLSSKEREISPGRTRDSFVSITSSCDPRLKTYPRNLGLGAFK